MCTNAIATLDLRSNPDAEFVMCGENRLTSVDVSRCPDLVQLQCENNLLSSLDVSANRKLNLLNLKETRVMALRLLSRMV